MSAKLDKLGEELAKAKSKWQMWEAKARELEAKYQEQENLEICDLVHAYRLNPNQLTELLQLLQDSPPETAATHAITENLEEMEEVPNDDHET